MPNPFEPGRHALMRTTLAEILASQALNRPDAEPIIVQGMGSLTFSEWKLQADRVAQRLVKRIVPGELVGVRLQPFDYVSFAVLSFGVMLAGGTPVPFTHVSHANQVIQIRSKIHSVIGKELLDIAASDPSAAGESREPPELAFVLLTSGVTGAPKAVACPHESFLPSGDQLVPLVVPKVLHSLPYASNGGVETMVAALRGNLCNIVSPTTDASLIWRDIEQRRPDQLLLTPTHATGLLGSRPSDPEVARRIKAVWLSSSFAPPALLKGLGELFPSAEIVNVYSLTEAAGASTAMVFDEARPFAVGRSGPWGQVMISTSSTSPSSDPGPNVVGEVWIRGGRGHRWYLDDPESSNHVFAEEGWVRTGDLGFIDEQGFLNLVGREKELIISGGKNFSPLPIEAALIEHEDVSAAFAFGLPHSSLGEFIAAAIVVNRPSLNDQVLCSEVLDFARRALPPDAVPRIILALRDVPLTEGQKADRDQIKARISSLWVSRHLESPRSTAERAVVEAWSRALGHSDFGIDDDFVSVGGDSLSAVSMLYALQEILETGFPLESLSYARTIRELAAIVSQYEKDSSSRSLINLVAPGRKESRSDSETH